MITELVESVSTHISYWPQDTIDLGIRGCHPKILITDSIFNRRISPETFFIKTTLNDWISVLLLASHLGIVGRPTIAPNFEIRFFFNLLDRFRGPLLLMHW
jgi:hypothetical protein